jgi:hypothetical protein
MVVVEETKMIEPVGTTIHSAVWDAVETAVQDAVDGELISDLRSPIVIAVDWAVHANAVQDAVEEAYGRGGVQ